MPQYDDGSESPLDRVHCFITTHDASGNATFREPPSNGSEEVNLQRVKEAAFNVHYATYQNPVSFTDDKDLKAYLNPSGIVPIAIKNGSVLRMVDLAPGCQSPMHRTNSLDYGVVLAGEADLILQDLETGPRRRMRVGDVSVQRGTLHAWKNTSDTKWLRMLYVLLEAEPREVDGKKLDEDWGGIELPK